MARRLAYAGRHRKFCPPAARAEGPTAVHLPFDPAALRHHRRLVGRMADGDTAALQELHELMVARVHPIIGRILSDREEVREAIQDAFVKAWQRAGAYRSDRGEVISWLLFIARNTAIDRLRAKIRRDTAMTALAADPVTTDVESPAAPVFDQREALDAQLAALTAGQRQALELAFYSDCSQAQIAQHMGVPISTVKNHLNRGLTKLRRLASSRHD